MPNAPTDLPDNDQALVQAVREGRIWRAGDGYPTPEQLADPDFVETMPIIRASTVRSLCLGLWDDVLADSRGVRIDGARIVDEFDMSFCTGQVPLSLRSCRIEVELNVTQANFPALYLVGSYLAAGMAGSGLRLGGDLLCKAGFTSKGTIRLRGAKIGGAADFSGAMLDGNGHAALSASRMHVIGSLICRSRFISKGTIRLIGARIGGAADFSRAVLDGNGRAALSANRMQVTDGLLCRAGFTSKGMIRLLGAQIGSNVELNGARLNGNGKAALNADRMQVIGSLLCRADFVLEGSAILVGANISGLLDWRPSFWAGKLDLSHASVGRWRDAWDGESWSCPEAHKIVLDHFSYGAFRAVSGMKTDSTTRIAWIKAAQGDDFRPGPYYTLARVLRAAGDDRGAAAVGLAMARARAAHQAGSYGWLRRQGYRMLAGFFDLTIGHGYRPWGAAPGLVLLLILGTLLFGWGAPTPYGGPGLIKPAEPVFISANQTRNMLSPSPAPATPHGINYTLPPEYTPFSAFWYSFDTLVPLIDLGQERAWSPSPLVAEFKGDVCGWLLLFYLYIHIIMGWVLTTLTVVALTGLIKRDKEAE